MSEKLCVFCGSFDNDPGTEGGDCSSGEPETFECRKGHWQVGGDWRDNRSLISAMRWELQRAKDCPDYREAKLEPPPAPREPEPKPIPFVLGLRGLLG